MSLTRRKLLGIGGAVAAASLFGLGACGRAAPVSPASRGNFEVMRSDAQWRQQLTPAQYAVLRGQGTERAFSSPLNDEHRRGTFHCAGCALALFSSATKFDSGTGWPSFWAPLHGAVGEDRDTTFGMLRVAVHCRRCGGHLGHVFNDGPRPTGLRYCMNGVAMNFIAA
ncbi:peptide-methionine (R)-S-oxide reductase MsrB [Stenotrophomonas sp. SY1]|uniref:peptide-methionine (R)-S-oxide reductase MsrB n=1 Tax=Stenotrophomonas sp. SY1 TaxID=477235 RepID=UPI001E50971A|nr:peptide-methionine (R)-S-oxide reductase MsrB [Stenotrophomonas sp. SY1]MCD9087947.1 peptide-methionine (R)-S-oxide reductase MsrB [Stenotrophomonas sp. SY1]